MKPHFERVKTLREKREARLKKLHIVTITSIFALLIALVLLGALIPGFYEWLDSTPPWVQILIVIVPGAVYAWVRLKKLFRELTDTEESDPDA